MPYNNALKPFIKEYQSVSVRSSRKNSQKQKQKRMYSKDSHDNKSKAYIAGRNAKTIQCKRKWYAKSKSPNIWKSRDQGKGKIITSTEYFYGFI